MRCLLVIAILGVCDESWLVWPTQKLLLLGGCEQDTDDDVVDKATHVTAAIFKAVKCETKTIKDYAFLRKVTASNHFSFLSESWDTYHLIYDKWISISSRDCTSQNWLTTMFAITLAGPSSCCLKHVSSRPCIAPCLTICVWFHLAEPFELHESVLCRSSSTIQPANWLLNFILCLMRREWVISILIISNESLPLPWLSISIQTTKWFTLISRISSFDQKKWCASAMMFDVLIQIRRAYIQIPTTLFYTHIPK